MSIYKRIFWRGCLIVIALFFILFTPVLAGTGVDSIGNRITVPDKNQRIVSLSPGATETLYALGLKDEIVGVSEFCNYPPDFVTTKPKIGGFSTPNIEKIQAVSPHIVIVTRVVPIQVKYQFEQLDIELFVAEPKSFNALMDTINQFGKLFNREEEAHLLIQGMKEEASEIIQAIRSHSVRPVKTIIEIWQNPYYAAGKNTLPGDIVTMAGGIVIPETGKEYPLLNEESILKLNPEALILGHRTDQNSLLKSHSNISSISAIRNNKVFSPDPDEFLRPGPRVINALKEIAQFLHPEAF